MTNTHFQVLSENKKPDDATYSQACLSNFRSARAPIIPY